MTAACSMASLGSCVQARHGATSQRPMVPARLLRIASLVDDGFISLICPTCQMSTSALDECRLLCMGLFSIFLAGSAEVPPCPSAASGRLHHPIADDATARGLEPSPLLPQRLQYFHQLAVHELIAADH